MKKLILLTALTVILSSCVTNGLQNRKYIYHQSHVRTHQVHANGLYK